MAEGLVSTDRGRVLAAMGSGEWLRTQWVARVAFGGPVSQVSAVVRRALPVLRRLEQESLVERRWVEEWRSGEIEGVAVQFPIPRSEWRRLECLGRTS